MELGRLRLWLLVARGLQSRRVLISLVGRLGQFVLLLRGRLRLGYIGSSSLVGKQRHARKVVVGIG